MATKGSRKAAASSHALNVGAHTPMSGENASPTPPAVPSSPLSSAYVRTALMNDSPTSGPISNRRIQNAREASSSRHSFASIHRKAPLRERKEHLFERSRAGGGTARDGSRRQLVERAFAPNAPAAQEHESVAHARRVAHLVDREEQRAPCRGMRAESRRDLADLTQIEPVEIGRAHV